MKNKYLLPYIICITLFMLLFCCCTEHNTKDYYHTYGIVKDITIDNEYNMTTHTYMPIYIQKVIFNDTIIYMPSKRKPNLGDTIKIIKYY